MLWLASKAWCKVLILTDAWSRLKVATDLHWRLVRNKSASDVVIPKASLDLPLQGAQIDQNNPPKSDVIVLLWICLGRPEHVVKAWSRPCQNSLKASRSVNACYESWGQPNSQGLLRAALEVCYESIWGLKVEAILDPPLRGGLECRSVATFKETGFTLVWGY